MKKVYNPKVERLSKEKVTELLFLAEGEAEWERLQCVVVKASSLSSTQARKMYGFHDMNKRITKMNEAAVEAQSIKDCIEICRIKDRALLCSFGVDDEDSTSESESESDLTPREKIILIFHPHLCPLLKNGGLSVPSLQQCLDMLCLCDLNWFAFVETVHDMFKDTEIDAVENVISDFKEKLSSFEISSEDLKIIDQSYVAYTQNEDLPRKQRNVADGIIVSDSESSGN